MSVEGLPKTKAEIRAHRTNLAFQDIKKQIINSPIVQAVMQCSEFSYTYEREDVLTFCVDETVEFTIVKYSDWSCFFQTIYEGQAHGDFLEIPFDCDDFTNSNHYMGSILWIIKQFERYVTFDLYYRACKSNKWNYLPRDGGNVWDFMHDINSFPRKDREDYKGLPAKQKLPKSNDGIEYGVIVRNAECPGKFSSKKIMVLKLGHNVFDLETFIV